jgi:hypothetical protein
MSGNFHDANYNVTKIRTEDGNIAELELNGKAVDLSGGGTSLDSNKAVTIDVSEYTTPVVINPSSGKDGMKKATVTLDNIPEPDLETNHAATINVSAYSSPVEIEPTAGKDGMEKVTVTLNNIPSQTTVKLYAWKAHRPGESAYFYIYTSFPATDEPYIMSTSDLFLNVFDSQSLFAPSTDLSTKVQLSSFDAYASGITYGKPTLTISSKTQFQLRYVTSGGSTDYTFVRDSSKDFTVWPSIFQS